MNSLNSTKIVLGIVGEIGSGKGAAAEYLHGRYGAQTFRFSTPMRDCLKRLHIPETRENLQVFSLITRETFGQDLYSKAIALDASEAVAPMVIAEGVRRIADIAELSKLPSFHLIAIVADEKTRFDRVKRRNENDSDAAKTWEQFKKEASAETELTIREIASRAEVAVSNDGTLEELHRKLDEVVAKLKG
jgi:dephospho-CoA kinase